MKKTGTSQQCGPTSSRMRCFTTGLRSSMMLVCFFRCRLLGLFLPFIFICMDGARTARSHKVFNSPLLIQHSYCTLNGASKQRGSMHVAICHTKEPTLASFFAS